MIVWGYWFGAFIAVFLVLELLARFKIAPWPTLSRTVWRATKQYPIFPFIVGMCIGGLAVHFFGLLPACNP